jgi:DNA primase
VIAFGGRQMDPDQGGPKYLNSPETPIYSKSRTLYGLNLTKTQIRKSGFAVLVEGYFDFAQLFQSQAAPVVASCGTALTALQAHLLRRFTSNIVLSFDPDAAGQGAATRSCEMLVTEGFDVNVVVLDKGEDPDTFIRRKGADEYRVRLRSSRPYLEYLLDQASAGLDFGHDDSRRQFLSKMLTVAARIPDAAARDQFADRIAHKARITEEVVRSEIRKAAVGRKTIIGAAELPSLGNVKDAEKALIWWLVNRPTEALEVLEDIDEEDLDDLFFPQVLVALRHRVPRARIGGVEAEEEARVVPQRAETRGVDRGSPRDRRGLHPGGVGPGEEVAARSRRSRHVIRRRCGRAFGGRREEEGEDGAIHDLSPSTRTALAE